ncbi:hypothetical protein BGX27_002472 [Mortierella sp. AM989]|nr:hypothetical protein BGX27_002472 [Mortierella sp. AM989]
MFHHPPKPCHGRHPLNRITSYQQHSSSGSCSATAASMNSYHDKMKSTKNQQEQQKPKLQQCLQPQHERKITLTSPPNYTRIRKSSDSSLNSLKRASEHYQMMAKMEEMPSVQGTSISYDEILKQIASQRAKLSTLQTGAQALSEDIVALDATLGEEQGSMNTVLQDAHTAINGWQDAWNGYSRCEPLRALQDKPNIIAMLIQSMCWEDKKYLFEQIVASCRPRETYQLQHHISVQHGQIVGFDLLEEFPFIISKLIMARLNFEDLASCRMVSRSWKHAATAYDVLASAVNRVTFVGDSVSLESMDESRKNWNQLCRYHERDLRWIKAKPASLHAMLGHTSYVTSVKTRGEWIISGGYDEKVRLWEAATGKCIKIWEVDSAVSCVELLVDPNAKGGGVVVAAFADIGLVKVWSLHGPLNMHTLTGHQKGVRAIAINEIYLVTAGFDQTVLVWNWSTGRKVASFRAHNEVILGVHLSNDTVYTFCIDATLRVFDIPSRTLLYQAKLFDVQQGSSLQWSYLHDRMLLTATNKKVYVWQLEHLDSLVHQQQLRLSFRSSVASAASSDNNSTGGSNDGQSMYLEIDRQCRTPLPRSRSASRSRSTSPFNYAITPPRTPSNISFSSSCLSYFSNTNSESSSALSLPGDPSSRQGVLAAVVETKVKPCLTAVLNMAIDMWCGKVTHHDPPLLIIGSRSSPAKLVAIELNKDVIDSSKVYDSNSAPLLISPKGIPVQGMPAGHGRGVMCIDSDTNKLVVGCTGGSIHALYMDPAKRTLASGKPNPGAPSVIILPHLSPTQMDSIRSMSPLHPSVLTTNPTSAVSLSRNTRSSNLTQPKRTISSVVTPVTSRTNSYGLPSPDHSPRKPSIPLTITTPTSRSVRGASPQRRRVRTAKQPATPPSDYEEQEVLVDCEEDPMGDMLNKGLAVIHGSSSAPINTSDSSITNQVRSKKSIPPSPTRVGSQRSVGVSKGAATNSTSHTLSSLSKFIQGPPSRIMMRRRATSAADQATNAAVNTNTASSTSGVHLSAASTPAISIMKERSRSDTNLLSSVKSSVANTTPKSLSKSWSLPSPWTNASKRSSKSKAA